MVGNKLLHYPERLVKYGIQILLPTKFNLLTVSSTFYSYNQFGYIQMIHTLGINNNTILNIEFSSHIIFLLDQNSLKIVFT